MRTIKGEAGFRAADRGRFPAKKPIFGHKFEGRRRKNEQKVTAVSRPQLHRVLSAGRARKNRGPRHTSPASCSCFGVKRSGLLVPPANSSRPPIVPQLMASSSNDQPATGGAVVPDAGGAGLMASSSSDQPATGGAVVPDAGGAGRPPGEELGSQITHLRRQQQQLVREKKRLQANLRNAQRKKNRLCKRTRMLSDMDLLEIMRMRAATSKDTKDGEKKRGKAAEAKSSGGAASSDAAMPAGDASSKTSDGNAVELEHMDSEGSPAA